MKYSFLHYLNEQYVTFSDVFQKDDCDEKPKEKKGKKGKKKFHGPNLVKYFLQHNIIQ